MIEVGALNIGRITNFDCKNYQKGDEKGFFSFGGSTIILLIKENVLTIDEDILNNSHLGIETAVHLGEKIAIKK